ncbi:FitA-like ribbon-helix-helix domain-containing protein [Ornithinimicrobium faecis]|uniref:FitA-like ribbon-helix-helix domain-containing protein n=1 Tax=Ornithinimicrobium faecis TaxID=2934158 RepID=UPI00211834DC|nr:hypothetical protein [Ornithinimicrobium sp. HY1745]
MSTLYVRDVPEETKSVLARMAAEHGASMSEYVRGLLDKVAQDGMKAQAIRDADAQLAALHANTGPWPSQAEVSQALDEVRDEYETGDSS